MALEALFLLAEENINAVPFHSVQGKCLRLYVDVSLLQSLLDLVDLDGPPEGEDSRAHWRRAIKRLDLAIIVGGAVGQHRRRWILSLITCIQNGGYPRHHSPEQHPLRSFSKRRRSMERSDRLNIASRSIPVLPNPPTIDEYLNQHYSQPFIIRGYAASYSAVTNWSSAEYLLDAVGEGRYVPVEVGEAYDAEGWGQKIIPFRDFLSSAGFDVSPESDEMNEELGVQPLYLAQHSLFNQFPALEKDFLVPEYVWSGPATPSDAPDYRPPITDDGVIINVWIGNGGKGVDPYYNCYLQVLGRKCVWLAPPCVAPHMYCHAESGDEDTIASKYMHNTSTVPIFLRDETSTTELRQRFPDFFERVVPLSHEAILNPGDLLVFGPGWWHAMRGEGDGPGWSISMWY
ncbi:hypothetical protein M231_02423 [Tremella mesenterica]|uniref:JmjC domain-containing protein n=1 Tax=Tremella mesenterica TaxID=5217 RepID=A0A4Q1BQT9_TREME|nr:hypothetical protein M231_02423 [Tremella mesenterica]